MKINEANIDYNAQRLISEIIGEPFEYNDENKGDEYIRTLTIGECKGVLLMAEVMKAVLRA